MFAPKNKKKQSLAQNRSSAEKLTSSGFFETSLLIKGALFILFSLLVILICFIGQSPAGPKVFSNQIANIRIVAEFPFRYKSKLQTERLIQERSKRVPPVYRLNFEPFLQFKDYLAALEKGLDNVEDTTKEELDSERTKAIELLVNEFESQNPYNLNKEHLNVLINNCTKEERKRLFKEGLWILRELYSEGILDENKSKITAGEDNLTFFDIRKETGYINEVQVKSEAEALRFLRINLAVLTSKPNVAPSLFYILKEGLVPNLIYDQAKSEEKIKAAVDSVKPVWIQVQAEQTIIEPDARVTPEKYEQLSAYRQKLHEAEQYGFSINNNLIKRILLSLLLFLSVGIYLKTNLPKLSKDNRRLALSALVILINLVLVRILIQLGEMPLLDDTTTLAGILPYIFPAALAPIVVTIMIGAAPGILVALIISVLVALMQSDSIEILLASFSSSLVGIYLCRDPRMRGRVVRASSAAGLTLALNALALGLINALSLQSITQQMLAAISTGFLTGIAVVGLLPIFESIFRYTTDITLLELTDFNHPLLRRMQVEAPGTYHHSLVVATLAERAANEIGANPLVCRACALYHDIGKLYHPGYFIENQKENVDVHANRDPSVSAQLIKKHVKNGVELAKKNRLPRIIIDVIQQHHGTGLIQYFYVKALQEGQSANQLLSHDIKPNEDTDSSIDESIYRYEGPRPRFKESAIILFADTIEAASRTLKKVSPENVNELLDRLFRDRIEDEQLAESPLTFEEIHKIKKSFSITLLNMLHARIEYPDKDKFKKNKTPVDAKA